MRRGKGNTCSKIIYLISINLNQLVVSFSIEPTEFIFSTCLMNVIGLFPIACASPMFALITDENGFFTPCGTCSRIFKHHDNINDGLSHLHFLWYASKRGSHRFDLLFKFHCTDGQGTPHCIAHHLV